jgi:ribosomal protein S18 acetylase RimI-like enzyme
MDCCQGSASEEFFDDRFARRELKRYRRRGPARWTRKLLSAIEGASVPADSTLLDVGGGVGAIHHELLEHGFARATQIDASSAYLDVAAEEVERLGHHGRVDLRRGDFHTSPWSSPGRRRDPGPRRRRDPDFDDMLSQAALHALRLVAFTYPRPRWIVRVVVNAGTAFAHSWAKRSVLTSIPRSDGRRPRAERHASALGGWDLHLGRRSVRALSAYRFCRTDDIALLVDAWNRCGHPHYPGTPPLTVSAFKQEIRELDLWCSSCMVAFDAKEPVAVLIGCKRPPHTLVHRIAVHPDHLRKGHGRHLLTSLSAKLAILGPPHLVAELPAGNAAARALFKACGWREERTYVDLVADSPIASPAPPGLVVSVTVDDLTDIALPAADAPRSWNRTRGTLLNRNERLLGLAIAGGEHLDASLLYSHNDDGHVAIWKISSAPGTNGDAALGVLLRELAHRVGAQLVVPRIHEAEVSLDLLGGLGLTRRGETIGVAAEAQSRA